MFTKEDYIEYFGQLIVIERKMIYELQDILSAIDSHTDPIIRNPMLRMLGDECRHYIYIKNILEEIFFKNGQKAKKINCFHFLGTADIRQKKTEKQLNGYCIHATKDSVYIEFQGHPLLEGDLNVELMFFENHQKTSFPAKMDWSVQISPEISMIKLQLLGPEKLHPPKE